MKTLTNLLASLILAGWVSAIAILSIQNITEVSLNFLGVESVKLPLGIVLAFSVGAGAIAGAIAPLVWQLSGGQRELYDDEDY